MFVLILKLLLIFCVIFQCEFVSFYNVFRIIYYIVKILKNYYFFDLKIFVF